MNEPLRPLTALNVFRQRGEALHPETWYQESGVIHAPDGHGGARHPARFERGEDARFVVVAAAVAVDAMRSLKANAQFWHNHDTLKDGQGNRFHNGHWFYECNHGTCKDAGDRLHELAQKMQEAGIDH